jgi:hypothetical protein
MNTTFQCRHGVSGANGRASVRQGVAFLGFILCSTTMAVAQRLPPSGPISILVAVDTGGQSARLSELEDSANALRRAIRGHDWLTLATQGDAADVILTLTDRHKDSSKGFVLAYVLRAGDYKNIGEYSYEGGTDFTGGNRTLSSDGRTSYEGRRPQSWGDQAKQFAQSLEAFAKANYERILRQRSPKPDHISGARNDSPIEPIEKRARRHNLNPFILA